MSAHPILAAGVLGACLAALVALGACRPSPASGTPANENFVQPSNATPAPTLLGGPSGPPAGGSIPPRPDGERG
jgi:hypothetical protein